MNGNLWRARLLAAVGVLACGLLGACGGSDGDAAPSASPKFSSSSAVVGSTSPVPTESSSAAVAETPEAFVRRWNELNTRMQNTGDITAYLAVSQSCSACSQVAKQVQSYYAAGGSVETSGWTLKTLECTSVSKSRAHCQADVVNSPTEIRATSNADPETLKGGPFTALFDLTYADAGSWNVNNLEQQAR